jgi:hypothetical protein
MRMLLTALLFLAGSAVADLPAGYWDTDQSQLILDKTLRITLDPDLSHLTAPESRAVTQLLAAGRIMHNLYESQLHSEAADAAVALANLHSTAGPSLATQNLLDLWYLSNGPIATTLDNKRSAFLPVAAEQPGRNFYPAGITRDEIESYLGNHADEATSILNQRTIVRRASSENLAFDIAQLDAYPAVDVLHIGLREKLESLHADSSSFYAVPYALVYAPELHQIRLHLHATADLLQAQTPDFASYLRNRARDFLSGDYESGDAAWVSGDFDALNVALGSYETYDDKLRGVKASFGLSILARDAEKSRVLEEAMSELQAIENSLPYEHHKAVRTKIPIGVYNIIADFGQSRSANTATILPNDADHTRKYGRTILLRSNIMTHPELFANTKQRFDAVIDDCCRDHLTSEGGFNRTLWHEVGHYLGVAKTADGRDLGSVFADHADLLEELKSDLVSLYSAPALRKVNYFGDEEMRSHYADGIRRTLQIVKPRAEQPYQNMQLMQFNFYRENGLIEANVDSGLLTIHYDRYHDVIADFLAQVLQIQYAGDYDLATEFIARWNYWDDELHGGLAQRMRDAVIFRWTMVRYGALGD